MADEKSDLQKAAEKALRLKTENDPGPAIPEHRTSGEGMRPNPDAERPPSGALDAEGFEPALSRGRGVRRSDQG